MEIQPSRLLRKASTRKPFPFQELLPRRLNRPTLGPFLVRFSCSKLLFSFVYLLRTSDRTEKKNFKSRFTTISVHRNSTKRNRIAAAACLSQLKPLYIYI